MGEATLERTESLSHLRMYVAERSIEVYIFQGKRDLCHHTVLYSIYSTSLD